MHLKVRYVSDKLKRLQYVDGRKSDWIDLRAAEDVIIHPGGYRPISLGVAIELPEGYEAIIAPRSSTFKNFGIIMANSIGIMDESFCGNDDILHFPAYAVHTAEIHFNDRIAQFRIIKHQPELIFDEVPELIGPNRTWHGSTGIN